MKASVSIVKAGKLFMWGGEKKELMRLQFIKADRFEETKFSDFESLVKDLSNTLGINQEVITNTINGFFEFFKGKVKKIEEQKSRILSSFISPQNTKENWKVSPKKGKIKFELTGLQVNSEQGLKSANCWVSFEKEKIEMGLKFEGKHKLPAMPLNFVCELEGESHNQSGEPTLGMKIIYQDLLILRSEVPQVLKNRVYHCKYKLGELEEVSSNEPSLQTPDNQELLTILSQITGKRAVNGDDKAIAEYISYLFNYKEFLGALRELDGLKSTAEFKKVFDTLKTSIENEFSSQAVSLP